MIKKSTPTIVVLDGYTLHTGDLSWAGIHALGETTIYDRTSPEKCIERAQNAEILLVNKVNITAEILEKLPKLRCICVTATGFNNVDTVAAAKKNIPVCNVKGYSSNSVAQHVFAMIFELTNAVAAHHKSVQNHQWSRSKDFCYTLQPITGLAGKTFGIYGFGQIGQTVAKIALAFGMKVIAKHKHPDRDKMAGVTFVNQTTLFEKSDILSLHAPLNAENEGLINRSMLKMMKANALLINTARGGFIIEKDLKTALKNNSIAGAALDVLSTEPPLENHILFDAKNCILTPHIAWANIDSRQRLLNETISNIEAFIKGQPRNMVNY